MNAFEVQLSARSFEAGGKVRGTVIFREAFSQLEKAAGVRVQLVMGVTGSGSKESKQVFDAMVHAGPVRAPTQLSFEAALPASGPCSYEGRYVKIGWQCKVSVDVDWAIDPVVIESFMVVPRRA